MKDLDHINSMPWICDGETQKKFKFSPTDFVWLCQTLGVDEDIRDIKRGLITPEDFVENFRKILEVEQ